MAAFLPAYFGEAIAARLHPNQIEDELHFWPSPMAHQLKKGFPKGERPKGWLRGYA